MKKFSLLKPWLGLCGLALSSGVWADNLSAVLARMLESNPDVQTQQFSYLAEQDTLAERKAGWYPSVDLQAGIGWESTNGPTQEATGADPVELERRDLGLSIRQPLYQGGRINSAIKLQKAQLETVKAGWAVAREQAVLSTAAAYVDVLSTNEQFEFVKDYLLKQQKLLKSIEQRSAGGAGTQAEVQQAKVQLAQASATFYKLKQQYEEASYRFRRWVGEMPHNLDPLPGDVKNSLPKKLDKAEQQAQNHPSLLMAKAKIRAAQQALNARKANFLPQLDLEVNLTDNNNVDGVEGRNADALAMLMLRYNLTNGGADRAGERAAHQRLQAAQFELEKSQRVLLEELQSAWAGLQGEKQQTGYLQQREQSAKSALSTFKTQFSLGKRTLLELLTAEADYFAAQTAASANKYQIQKQELRVLAAMGQLLPTLKIESVYAR